MRSHLTKLSASDTLVTRAPGSGPGPGDSRWQCRPTPCGAGKRRHHYPRSGLPQRALDRREREDPSQIVAAYQRTQRGLLARCGHSWKIADGTAPRLARFRRRLGDLRQRAHAILCYMAFDSWAPAATGRAAPGGTASSSAGRWMAETWEAEARKASPTRQAGDSIGGQAVHLRRQHQEPVRWQPLRRVDRVAD